VTPAYEIPTVRGDEGCQGFFAAYFVCLAIHNEPFNWAMDRTAAFRNLKACVSLPVPDPFACAQLWRNRKKLIAPCQEFTEANCVLPNTCDPGRCAVVFDKAAHTYCFPTTEYIQNPCTNCPNCNYFTCFCPSATTTTTLPDPCSLPCSGSCSCRCPNPDDPPCGPCTLWPGQPGPAFDCGAVCSYCAPPGSCKPLQCWVQVATVGDACYTCVTNDIAP